MIGFYFLNWHVRTRVYVRESVSMCKRHQYIMDNPSKRIVWNGIRYRCTVNSPFASVSVVSHVHMEKAWLRRGYHARIVTIPCTKWLRFKLTNETYPKDDFPIEFVDRNNFIILNIVRFIRCTVCVFYPPTYTFCKQNIPLHYIKYIHFMEWTILFVLSKFHFAGFFYVNRKKSREALHCYCMIRTSEDILAKTEKKELNYNHLYNTFFLRCCFVTI